MPKLDHVSHRIGLAEGSSASIAGGAVTVSNDGKSLSREFRHPKVICLLYTSDAADEL